MSYITRVLTKNVIRQIKRTWFMSVHCKVISCSAYSPFFNRFQNAKKHWHYTIASYSIVIFMIHCHNYPSIMRESIKAPLAGARMRRTVVVASPHTLLTRIGRLGETSKWNCRLVSREVLWIYLICVRVELIRYSCLNEMR